MTMKEYTLSDAESLADDISNINLLVCSGSIDNGKLVQSITNEMQSKIEELQSVLNWLLKSPDINSNE